MSRSGGRSSAVHGKTVSITRSQVKKLAAGLGAFVSRYTSQAEAAKAIGVPCYTVYTVLRRGASVHMPRPWLDRLGEVAGIDTRAWGEE